MGIEIRKAGPVKGPGSVIERTPGMGVIYRMKVPNGGWRAPTVSQGVMFMGNIKLFESKYIR